MESVAYTFFIVYINLVQVRFVMGECIIDVPAFVDLMITSMTCGELFVILTIWKT